MGLLSGFFDLFSKGDAPPEPLVYGAELQCPCGTEHSFLRVETDNLDINNLPQACVDDCKLFINIMPFGYCSMSGYRCESEVKLKDKWENEEPQDVLINGKEIITTESILICLAKGIEIRAVTSGQDGIFAKEGIVEFWMKETYPGLYELLSDPSASLYANDGMYQMAIRFIKDWKREKGGQPHLLEVYDEKDPKCRLLRSAFEKLMWDVDTSSHDRFIADLRMLGTRYELDGDEGWDILTLNDTMLGMIEKHCEEKAELVRNDKIAAWSDKSKMSVKILAEQMKKAAFGLAIYRNATGNKTIKDEKIKNEEIEKAWNKGESKRISPKVEKRLDDLVDDIRKDIGIDYPKGNVGAAITDIEGVTNEVKSYSKYNNSISSANINHEYSYNFGEHNRIFDVKAVNKADWVDGMGAYNRAIDSEAKILEDIAHQLGYNKFCVDEAVRGNVYLITERVPCSSCQDVIEQFMQMFPNVEVSIKNMY